MRDKRIKAPGPILRDFIGAPFKIGGTSKNEGYDGFSFFYLLHKRRGYDVPFSFDFLGAPDVTFDNYAELLEQDPSHIEKLVWSYVISLTEPLEYVGYLLCGDTVIVRDKDKDLHFCIYLGNGLIGIASVDYGIQALDRRYFDIVEGRRWVGIPSNQ